MTEPLPWRCDACAEPAVVFAPGSEEVRELFLLDAGQAMRCWCMSHWCAAYRVAEERVRA